MRDTTLEEIGMMIIEMGDEALAQLIENRKSIERLFKMMDSHNKSVVALDVMYEGVERAIGAKVKRGE